MGDDLGLRGPGVWNGEIKASLAGALAFQKEGVGPAGHVKGVQLSFCGVGLNMPGSGLSGLLALEPCPPS